MLVPVEGRSFWPWQASLISGPKKIPKENWYLLFESLISTRLLTLSLSLPIPSHSLFLFLYLFFVLLFFSSLEKRTQTSWTRGLRFHLSPSSLASTVIQLFSAVTARSARRSYALHIALRRLRCACANTVEQTTVWKKDPLRISGISNPTFP